MVRPDLYREWRPPNQPQTRPAGPSGREQTLFFFFFYLLLRLLRLLLALSLVLPPSPFVRRRSSGAEREGGRGDPKRGKEEQEEGVGGLLAPRRTHTGGTGKTQARQAWGGGRHEVEPERHGENEDWRRLETAASQGQVDALPLACRYRRPETRPQPIVRGVQGLAPVLVAPPSRREAPREGVPTYPVRKSGTGAGTGEEPASEWEGPKVVFYSGRVGVRWKLYSGQTTNCAVLLIGNKPTDKRVGSSVLVGSY